MGRSHAQLAFLSLAPLFPILFLLLFSFSLAARNDQTARKIASAEMDFMQKLLGQFNSAGGAPWPNTAVGYAPTIQEKTCADQDASKLGLEFRLNELESGEKLIRADLHLFFPASHSRGHSPAVHFSARKERGKLHGKKLPPESIEMIRLINCAEDEKVQLKRRPGSLAALADGWATFEAADLVQHSMRDPEGKGRLLVQFHRHGRQLSPAQLSRLLHLHRPFLVVYTDSEEEATSFGGFDGEKRGKREVRARLTNYEEEEAVRQHMETARKTAEYYAYGMTRSSPAASDGSGLPVADIPKANKGSMAMLNRRRQKSGKGRRKAVRSYPGFDPNDPMLGFGTRDSPWDRSHRLLQSPNSGNSLNDIRSLRENSYKLEAKQDPEEQGETKVLLLGGAAEQQSQRQQASKCARHNMTVDFRELGWADRIIAPKRFEAGYCAGSCHHPMEQDQKPSNHAILQALIAQLRSKHQQQQAPGTPPPVCCAPEKFDSLTLLYFDERDNVVLKNYQRISVIECACI